MMLGSVGDLLKEPAEKTMFIEDMTDTQLMQAVSCLFDAVAQDSRWID
jgi:hypothetical protein